MTDLLTAPPPRLRLRLPATLPSVEMARQALLDFFAPERPSAGTVADVELVLEEVMVNIAAHAYPAGHAEAVDTYVALDIGTSATEVAITFEDGGIPFDPTSGRLRDVPASLAEIEPGGLGLRLLRGKAASMDYRRSHGRNVLTVSVARR